MNNNTYRSVMITDPYCPAHLSLFELLYGKNLISLGGLASVDAMFDGINIKGLHALDIGFGLGGAAYYLAERYQMNVSGVEIYQWMADYANQHIPPKLATKVRFGIYDQYGDIPYQGDRFALVYSKGVLNHVKQKVALFRQIIQRLQPGGQLVIADWLTSDAEPNYAGPIVSETRSSYSEALDMSGFSGIDFRNEKSLFQRYVSDFLLRLEKNRTVIERQFDKTLFSALLEQHNRLYSDITTGKKIPVRIVAHKNNIGS